MSSKFRTERDSMGEMQVPASAYYGPQTQRAVENFPISGLRFGRQMIAALGAIKRGAAVSNSQLGFLDGSLKDSIVAAATEVVEGKLDDEFVVDIFQTGSGTSSNMNTNEVIARRATELAGGDLAAHPNDHVNMSQSSNDVIPSAIHIAAAVSLVQKLYPALERLHQSLEAKSKEFTGLVKTGRTHLQDATPIDLGQEFSGFVAQVAYAKERLEASMPRLLELPLGGSAVGTGLNTHPEFAARAIAEISKSLGVDFVEARNHFEAHASRDALVEISGQLRVIACSFSKIANDIRWLGSGPRCGLGELNVPAVQPGSSIMPGKVNPVICESVLMIAAQVIGNDATIALSGHSGGNFQLNVMLPVIGHNIIESIEILASGAENFAERCVDGIEANKERLHELAELSIASCTALAPIIGYDKAAEIAKTAFKEGLSVREVAIRMQVLDVAELDRVLDLLSMTKPNM